MTKKNSEADTRAKLRRRRRLRQLLGAAVCLLVVIGLLSAVSGSVRFVGRLFDDTAEREEYAKRLEYLVALDPLPFDTMSNANMNTLLDAAVWGTIAGTNSDDYEHDEVGAMYLPTADIDKTVQALYGPEVKFNYATFEDHGLTFNLVAEKQAYLVPITSAPTDYAPVVERIKREGNTKRLTVGYDSPYDQSDLPVKYNDYIFTKGDDGKYYLSGIVPSQTKAEVLGDSSSASGATSLAPDNAAVLNDAAAAILPETAPAEAGSVPPESTASVAESASSSAAA
ncbi:MAG: hypothetical protein RR825_00985 [Ruthenibacterium sp.]